MTRRAVLALLAGAAVVSGAAAAAERARAPEGGAAQACPRHGAGFVQVPGSTTCIRIGGRVRADYGASSGRRTINRDEIAGFGPSGSLSADVRADTDAGPLRAYVRTRAGGGPAGGR